MTESTIELVVRCTEIDINGHVNNAKYVEYLEWGREDWYEGLGFTHAHLLTLGVLTVTVNLNVNYRRECRQGERLFVTTRSAELGNSSFVVTQEIRDKQGRIVCDARVTTVTIDSATRKSRRVPDALRAAFSG
jgi:YbgC/YbaW family acyl-CoA thioester hydrolase